uniref:NADH dehydrogenase subunit 3 n=1 Tax=Novaculina chinensis TaxID=3033849 RepID=UPI002551F7C5|nr:NADH dehydrogenase subunit 3 [Novaculina chinensis]WGC44267.1 NADH dehydrogenase subunit 3 [Novaculina chinensis]
MTFFMGGLYFMIVIMALSFVLALVGLILGKKTVANREKLTSFECGFDPLSSARSNFSLRFFLLAIVFLIFDIELALLVPYFYSLGLGVSLLSSFYCFLFIIVLFLGLVHEFNEGTLSWFDA